MPVVTVLNDSYDTSTVKVEGKVYNFDDRTGLWTVWTISNMTVNLLPLPTKSTRSLNDVILFMKRQIMRLNPVIYSYGLQPSFDFHITNQIGVGRPGGTSYLRNSIVRDSKSGTMLVERTVKIVTVDKNTRRPSKVSEKFLDMHSGTKPITDLSEILSTKLNIPDFSKRCFQWKTTIRHSDLDKNQHSNQSVYLKLCLDCATCAALGGRLRHFDSDMCRYPVTLFDITFFGESFAGDELNIYLLQDEKDISILHFIVVKDKQQITYSQFKFELVKLYPKRQSLL